MKKHLSILLVMAVALMGLSACQKTKDKLVGTWKYTEEETVKGDQTTVDGTRTFAKDGTFTESATATFTAETKTEEGTIQVKVGLSVTASGNWELQNSDEDIVMSVSKADVQVEYINYYDPSDGSLLEELTGEDLEEASAVYVEELEASLKKGATERIVKLEENKYETQSTDEKGKTSNTIYTKQ